MLNNLKLFLIVLIAAFTIFSCGKDETVDKPADNTKTELTSTDDFDESKGIMVEFDIKGDMNGTMKTYYKDKRGKVEYNMQTGGAQMNSQIYSDNEWVYIITNMAGQKMGMKMNAKKYTEKTAEGKDEIDMTSFREKLKEYKKIGTEEILGKTADIYEIKPGNTISVYKSTIPLKMVVGKTTMTATKYETDLDLSDDFFTPPKDINYMDASDMQKGMENMDGKMKDLEEMMKKYKQ